MAKVLVLYCAMYGHVERMAEPSPRAPAATAPRPR